MPTPTRPTLVAFLGDLGRSEIEVEVGRGRTAATLDSIESALSSGCFADAVLVTDAPREDAHLPGLSVDVDSGAFHFGKRLAEVIESHHLQSVVYMGGGSVPLLAADDFATIARSMEGGQAVTNNRYSSDLVAFSQASSIITLLPSVDRDNALARAVAEGGITMTELPRKPETLFDIDGPTDLAVLLLTGLGGPRLCANLDSLELDTSRYEHILPIFLDQRKELLVAGRVGSHAWRYLETETACRVRLFAEERGMEADGRADDGSARSLLGYYLKSVGPAQFFSTLAELGNAALIDSRVLAAHALSRPSREDRFLSDSGKWNEISDPFLRMLSEGATEASIPVILGGHSLVSGGLMLLNEHAWRMRDGDEL
jgi:hypothetical protein